MTSLNYFLILQMLVFTLLERFYCELLPPVLYISFTSYNVSTKSDHNIISTKRLNQVAKSDDSPYEQIDLPWNFNYFGSNIYRIFVNPNGALHMINATQPKCDCFNDNFNTSYYGVIAGYLVDLNPSSSKTANITYSVIDKSQITVSFINVPLFGEPNITQSFDINLFQDGRITIKYIKITKQNLIPWISGVRIPYHNPSMVFFSNDINLANKGGSMLWKTKVTGIYPAKIDVSNNNQLTTCPISTLWCANPKHLNISTGQLNLMVTFVPLSISCLDTIQWAVYLEPNNNKFTELNDGTSIIPMNTDFIQTCLTNQTDMSLQCDILPLIRRNPNFIINNRINITFAWYPIVNPMSSYYYQLSPFIPIELSLYNHSLTFYERISSTSCSSSSSSSGSISSNHYSLSSAFIAEQNNCALNLISNFKGSVKRVRGTCGSTPCDICEHKVTCLHTTCDANTYSNLYTLPASFNCPNNCLSTTVYDHRKNICCNISETDCNGKNLL